jgi:peptide chain release factor subunit 1
VDIRHDLTASDVKDLAKFASSDHLVFSLYLDLTARSYPTKKDVEEQAASLIDAAIRRVEEKNGSSGAVKEAVRDARDVQRFIELEFSREGASSAAFFVCRPEKLERCYVLARPLRPRASFDKSPYVRPLNSLLTEYSPFGVILCNRRAARILRFHLGRQSGEEVVIEDDVHGKHDQGGWSQARYARHIDREAHNHYKHVAAVAEEYFKENPVTYLLLAGPVEDLVEARRCLPADLDKRVVRELHLDVHMKASEVSKVVDAVDAEVEAEEDARLVAELRDGLAAGKSVAGLEETLEAIGEGKARVLLVSRGYKAPGWRCMECSALQVVGPRCSRCGSGNSERVDDVVEEAIQETLKTGGRIELVSQNADLDVVGGIGVLLRF